MPDNMKENERI